MKTLVINNSATDWFSPFIELNNLFEPFVKYVEPVAVNVDETPHGYSLHFSIPDFRKKDLNISVDNGEIIIKGQKETTSGVFKKGKKAFSTSFEKRFAISEDMDIEKIKAKFKNGELQLVIPKKDEFVKYREIPVEGASIAVEANALDNKVKQGLIKSIKQKFQKTFNRAA